MAYLETERLIINELQSSDAQFTLALLNDPAFIEHIGDRKVRTLDQAQQYLREKVFPGYARNGFGMYAVRRKETGEAIGMCGLVDREGLEDIDLGYGFLPSARGIGYALEAARRILRWAEEDLKIRRLIAIVNPDNQASIALLENLDMQFESMVTLPGEEREICLFAWHATN